MKIQWESIRKMLLQKEWWLWGAFIFIGFCALISSGRSTSSPTASPSPDPASAETFIPRGHLLIPIEITNADRLEGLLGEAGIVDLYQTPTAPGERSQLVGRRLRLLRAPLNPTAFAVLLREAEVDRFLIHPGPFLASLRPLKEPLHDIPVQPKPSAKNFEIEYPSEASK